MITFIDTLSATCQRMNDKKDCEPIAICNQTKYNEEKKDVHLHILFLLYRKVRFLSNF